MKHFYKIFFLFFFILGVAHSSSGAGYTLTLDDVQFDADLNRITDYTNSTEKDIIIPSAFNVDGTDVDVKSIGFWAFKGKSLTSVELPSTLEAIYNEAFANNSLTSITLPDNTTHIGELAFLGNSLASVSLSANVNVLGGGVFNDNAITQVNGKTSNGLFFDRNYDGTKNHTRIVSYGGVADVIDFIPETVTAFDDMAFRSNGLTSVVIPSSVKSIGAGAFNHNEITEINGDPSNGIIYGRNSDGTEDNTRIISYGGASDVMDFIPNSVIHIEEIAFRGSGLTSLILPDNITSIAKQAFARNALTTVTIPPNITSLGEGAFEDNSLSSVTLPSTLTSIGAAAFNNNSISEKNGSASDGIIYGRTSEGSVDDTRIVSYGGSADVVDFIPSAVDRIDEMAFRRNSITSVSLPDNLTSLGFGAFMMNSITSVTLPAKVRSIGSTAFFWNPLTSFQLPTHPDLNSYGWKDEEGYTYDCGDYVTDMGLAYSIPIPYELTLDDVEFDASTGTITDYLNSEEDDIIIPSSFNVDGKDVAVVCIGEHSFEYNNLTSLKLPSSLVSVKKWAFEGNSLISLEFPANLTSIDRNAFSFNNLSSVSFSANLTSIGEYAFYENNLSSFQLPTHPEFNAYGWEDSQGMPHNGGDEVSNLGVAYTIPGVYDITYMLQGGENAQENPLSFHRDAGVTSFNPATRADYDFVGWFDGNDNEVTSIPSGTTQDIVLYAKWDVASGIAQQQDAGFRFYPNPASHDVMIEGEAESFEIYDISGRMVLQKSIREGRRRIDVSSLPNGVYILKAGNRRERLMIQR